MDKQHSTEKYTDQERLALIPMFQNIGADASQAQRMASQTVKRAEQLQQERGMGRVEALQYLLSIITSGKDGPDNTNDAS